MPDRMSNLRRYDRVHENTAPVRHERLPLISQSDLDSALDASGLSIGSRGLVRGLAELATVRPFPGGGLGIEYGSLLKTAVHPGLITPHVNEVVAHLRSRSVDVLLVPGMSGYPIGAIYSFASGMPAVLLKKNEIRIDRTIDYTPGAFVIPSYTGEGDVVMTADPSGVRSALSPLLTAQIERQRDAATVDLTIRFAGADDIIDKGSMAIAISESAEAIGEWAIDSWLIDYRLRTGDTRSINASTEVVAWVTPMMKSYNRPQDQLHKLLGITPFAGLSITSLQGDPPAIGIEGLGLIGLRSTP